MNRTTMMAMAAMSLIGTGGPSRQPGDAALRAQADLEAKRFVQPPLIQDPPSRQVLRARAR